MPGFAIVFFVICISHGLYGFVEFERTKAKKKDVGYNLRHLGASQMKGLWFGFTGYFADYKTDMSVVNTKM